MRVSPLIKSYRIFQSKEDEFWKKQEDLISNEVDLKERMASMEREAAKLVLEEEIISKQQADDDLIQIKSRVSKNDESSSSSSSSAAAATATATQNTRTKPDISINTMLEDEGIGIKGRWKEVAGNFIIYPLDSEKNQPKGVIHFLGGAFVGAAPHLTYRYLLDSLCDAGYIVIATPYRLELDYLNICDSILSRFDSVGAELAAEFGALPVIGVGHSCGALLHTLITSLFPDAPRAANVLISFNNKPVKEAIPAFDELIVPLSEQIFSDNKNDNSTSSSSSISNSGLREFISAGRSIFDGVIDGFTASDFTPPLVKDELLPIVKQSLEIVDQIPSLLEDIADGAREFTPSPEDTREAARRMYRARRTLLIQFENDAIDESPEIEKVLTEAYTIMRMKRPMVEMEVELKKLGGTHITPLTQNVILEPPAIQLEGQSLQDPLVGIRGQVRDNFLQTINDVKTEIVEWLQ